MPRGRRKRLEYQLMELDGTRYAVVREAALLRLCRTAAVESSASCAGARRGPGELEPNEMDRESLAQRLVRRRKRIGLTQASLARRAGIRVETLNRVERGHTTPDFATVRKLVVAMNQAEAEL